MLEKIFYPVLKIKELREEFYDSLTDEEEEAYKEIRNQLFKAALKAGASYLKEQI